MNHLPSEKAENLWEKMSDVLSVLQSMVLGVDDKNPKNDLDTEQLLLQLIELNLASNLSLPFDRYSLSIILHNYQIEGCRVLVWRGEKKDNSESSLEFLDDFDISKRSKLLEITNKVTSSSERAEQAFFIIMKKNAKILGSLKIKVF